MNVLVTGAAGYIGSHAVRMLEEAGHRPVALDNLSQGHREAVPRSVPFYEADIGDPSRVMEILSRHHIDTVMHFAAFIEVGESVVDPQKYYENNFGRSLALFQAMRQAGVKRIVFSSTAAVYGVPTAVPIHESEITAPINPYGRSKAMSEAALADFAQAYNFGYVSLRYFNVAGARPDGTIGEAHRHETHLIPRILSVASGQAEAITIYGTDYDTPDGTCIRDYVHVEDLAAAHVLALNRIEEGRGKIYNLGSENGFSVREVIEACRAVTGHPIPAMEKARRPGDPAMLIADSAAARAELGWQPRYPDLKTIVAHAWQWHRTHPYGYESKEKH